MWRNLSRSAWTLPCLVVFPKISLLVRCVEAGCNTLLLLLASSVHTERSSGLRSYTTNVRLEIKRIIERFRWGKSKTAACQNVDSVGVKVLVESHVFDADFVAVLKNIIKFFLGWLLDGRYASVPSTCVIAYLHWIFALALGMA